MCFSGIFLRPWITPKTLLVTGVFNLDNRVGSQKKSKNQYKGAIYNIVYEYMYMNTPLHKCCM